MNADNFNKDYANQVSKDQWVKEHAHHANDVDGGLESMWESLQVKKDAKPHVEKAPAKK